MFTIVATKALDAYANDPVLMAIMIGLGSWALLATLVAVWMRAATDGCRVASDDADEDEYLRATIVANRLARAVRDRSVPSERVQRILDIIKQTERPAPERGVEYGKLMATGFHAKSKPLDGVRLVDDIKLDGRPSVNEWADAFKKAGGSERLDDSKPLKHEGMFADVRGAASYAKDKGMCAYAAGLKLSQNPFGVGTNYDAWKQGWLDAQDETGKLGAALPSKPPTKREYAEQRAYDPTRHLRNAKARGKRAFTKGTSLNQNPFGTGAEFDAWKQGWMDAQVAYLKVHSK